MSQVHFVENLFFVFRIQSPDTQATVKQFDLCFARMYKLKVIQFWRCGVNEESTFLKFLLLSLPDIFSFRTRIMYCLWVMPYSSWGLLLLKPGALPHPDCLVYFVPCHPPLVPILPCHTPPPAYPALSPTPLALPQSFLTAPAWQCLSLWCSRQFPTGLGIRSSELMCSIFLV